MSYTYILTFKPTGQKYYGVRYSAKSDPRDLWVTYFSSSKIVHDLIELHGKDSFLAEIDKVFDSPPDAIRHEQKTLLEITDKSNWLNMSFGSGGYDHAKIKTSEHRRKIAKGNSKPKTGNALRAAIENAKLGAEARRGQKDSQEIRLKRARSVSESTSGKPKPWLRKKLLIDGEEFFGIGIVVERYGITRQTVWYRIKSEKWPNWNYAE